MSARSLLTGKLKDKLKFCTDIHTKWKITQNATYS